MGTNLRASRVVLLMSVGMLGRAGLWIGEWSSCEAAGVMARTTRVDECPGYRWCYRCLVVVPGSWLLD